MLVETRAAVRLAERLAIWTPHWWLALAVAVLVLGGGYRLLSLPLGWLGGFWLPRRYGLLHQSLGRWLWDAAKAALVGGALGLLAVEIVYGLMRWSAWWWLWGAVLFLGGYALLALVAPLLLVPLFYRLTPLPDGPLKSRLLALAARVGVPVTGVWVVDQSRKSRTANAAVSGSATLAASSCSTRCWTRSPPTRSRRCSRTSSRTSSTATSAEACSSRAP